MAAPPGPPRAGNRLLRGECLLVKYAADANHDERILLWPLGGTRWQVMTELGDSQRLDLATVEQVHRVGEDRVMPPGIPRNRLVTQEGTDRIYTIAERKELADEAMGARDLELAVMGAVLPPEVRFVGEVVFDPEGWGAWGPHSPP